MPGANILIPSLSKRSTQVVVRGLLLVALLHAVAFAQRGVAPPQPATPGGSYQLCTVTNGSATGPFGEVLISGTFTMGTTPNSAASNMTVIGVAGPVGPDGTVPVYTYSFAGPVNSSTTYKVKSQLKPTCLLGPIGCFPESASLHVSVVSQNTAGLSFTDSGEPFDGTGTLSCKSIGEPPPGPLGSCPNVVVRPAPVATQIPGSSPPKLTVSLDGLRPLMHASATPVDANDLPAGLMEGAHACGYEFYNWQQTITAYPKACPWYTVDPSFGVSVQLLNSWQDPPLGGYYEGPPQYPYLAPTKINPDAYPFYYDVNPAAPAMWSLTAHQFLDQWLSFSDLPGCPALPAGTEMDFTTTLVGVFDDTTTPPAPIYTWTWKSTYTGYELVVGSGGVSVLATTDNEIPLQPGTGGVTITSINGVQLPPDVPSNQAAVTASGLSYSRVTQTFNGTVKITNISSALMSGPLQVVFFDLPATVTLANAAGNLSGTAYLTVPAPAGIAPGQSVTMAVQFSNPSNVAISFTPAVYAGSFP